MCEYLSKKVMFTISIGDFLSNNKPDTVQRCRIVPLQQLHLFWATDFCFQGRKMPTECTSNPLQRELADSLIRYATIDDLRILLACGASANEPVTQGTVLPSTKHCKMLSRTQ